jgi:hypothetical protein
VKAGYAKCRKPYYLYAVGLNPLFFSSKTGHEKPCLKPEGPPSKAKYVMRSIVNKYREGKVKRTADSRVK